MAVSMAAVLSIAAPGSTSPLGCLSRDGSVVVARLGRMQHCGLHLMHTKVSVLPSVAEIRSSSRRSSKLLIFAKQAVAAPPGAVGSGTGGDVYDCVIVGGGVSGLCTAQALLTKHKEVVSNVLVTEGRERVGGNITTVSSPDGFLWEEGPNSFQPNDAVLQMAVDSGLKDDLVLGDPDSPRFVLWDNELRPVPAGPLDLPVFSLMSPLGKLRAGLGAMGLRPGAPGKEESVEEFVRRNLGAEVFERLIEPFCSGVYAGDPSKLSMKAAFGKVWRLEEIGGSIIGGVFKLIQEKKANPPPPRDPRLPKPKGQTVGSFKKGLVQLPQAIATALGDRVKLSWKLTGVKKVEGGNFQLSYETPEGPKTVAARSVVLTVPSYIAAEVLKPVAPTTAEALLKFYYPPVAAVTVSYPTSAIRDDRPRTPDGELKGFGQLHPRSQGLETLGTIYSSSLFPDRAPKGTTMLLNYIGGAKNTAIATKSQEEIVAAVDRDLRKVVLKPNAPPPRVNGVRVWPRAIPQFTVGHLDTLATARAGLANAGLEGLFLGGNYVAGVALGRCVEGGYESAVEVANYAKSLAPSS